MGELVDLCRRQMSKRCSEHATTDSHRRTTDRGIVNLQKRHSGAAVPLDVRAVSEESLSGISQCWKHLLFDLQGSKSSSEIPSGARRGLPTFQRANIVDLAVRCSSSVPPLVKRRSGSKPRWIHDGSTPLDGGKAVRQGFGRAGL